VLDTSTVIAYLKGDELASPVARALLEEFVASERNPAVISSITAAEVMVGPLHSLGRVPVSLSTFLQDFPGLTWQSADFLVAVEAAAIRARTGAEMPDAMIAATATVTSSPWLITNDRVLRDALAGFDWETQVLLLSEIEAAAEEVERES
jgi:predicted nucleic acid-binding protein